MTTLPYSLSASVYTDSPQKNVKSLGLALYFLVFLTASSRRFFFENKECPQNVLQVLPLYHIGGILLTLEELVRGNSLLISNAKYYMMQVERFEIQKLILVPAMAQNLFNKAADKEGIKEGLRTAREMLCVGAALQADTVAKMREYNIEPIVYYGLTETTGTVSCDGPYRDGACGRIAAYNEVKIENDEILVRGSSGMKATSTFRPAMGFVYRRNFSSSSSSAPSGTGSQHQACRSPAW